MRTSFDFAPLFRSTIGFDRVFDLLDAQMGAQAGAWPAYDIEKRGDDEYRITVAVPGLSADALSVTQDGTLLTVAAAQPAGGESSRSYLYRSIPPRTFERRFELADYVHVAGAALENGLLTIDLKRDLPEELKPRVIPIGRRERRSVLSRIIGDKQAA